MQPIAVIKHAYQDFWIYKRDYIKASVLFNLLRIAIISPILGFLGKQILKINGFDGITESTIFSLFKNPTSLALIALILLIFIFAIFFEFGLYFLYADHHDKYPLKFRQSLMKLLRKLRYFVSFQAVLFLIYFVLMIPLASIGLEGSFTSDLYIPHFITDELMKTTSGKLLYGASLALIFYVSMRLIYSIPYFVFNEKSTILGGINYSWQFTKRTLITTLLSLGGIVAIHSVITLLGIGLLFLPVMFIETVALPVAPYVSAICLTLIEVLLFVSFSMLQALFAEAIVTLLKNSEEIEHPISKTIYPTKHTRIVYPVIGIGLAIMTFFNYSYLTNNIYAPSTMIISHRGVTTDAIENTKSAIIAAKKEGADMVEIDVQQTKDRQFVLFHDDTLRRLGNSSKKISELTLEEVKQITLQEGNLKDKIPTLEDVLSLTDDLNMRLLIELKFEEEADGRNEAELINMLYDRDLLSRHYVQGLNQTQIESFEIGAPEVNTGYIVAFNLGSLPKTSADFMVMEEFSFNQNNLETAHKRQQQLFAWTINKQSLMRKYISMGADAIITDHPEQAQLIKQQLSENMSFTDRIKKYLDLR
ncbi:glycerophosphoryl diester phosphodiesterase membrane domain-containing protein [Vagococcus xieshaowenii]|uniref:glycerophosphoryl diester phosphodiesterase membrane domain-containing protein n=1 Tax=Vagococcus xieshaowenii TaxID=2562451 RepID=UPI00143254B0|nr:glycerophosphoryl diester phosphodiesterase membrane domain-containing protein [Vagococcus xieshaowenii]